MAPLVSEIVSAVRLTRPVIVPELMVAVPSVIVPVVMIPCVVIVLPVREAGVVNDAPSIAPVAVMVVAVISVAVNLETLLSVY